MSGCLNWTVTGIFVFISKSMFPKYFLSAVVRYGCLCVATGADMGLTIWKIFN